MVEKMKYCIYLKKCGEILCIKLCHNTEVKGMLGIECYIIKPCICSSLLTLFSICQERQPNGIHYV